MEKYKHYRAKMEQLLPVAVGKNWQDGVWKYTQKDKSTNSKESKEVFKSHILPLKNNENTSKNRANAINSLLGINCVRLLRGKLGDLHQYAHHLNSSQLLCMEFFSNLIDENLRANNSLVLFMKKVFGIEIHEGAECQFEYTERRKPYMFKLAGKYEYEGTSFDFHIKDGDVEVYFEIKFTENGFGKAKNDERHLEKVTQYKKLLSVHPNCEVGLQEFLENYQLLRNVIRANNRNKSVIFITDANNEATNKGIKSFLKLFGKHENVKFITWQEIRKIFEVEEIYPGQLPYQFAAMANYENN